MKNPGPAGPLKAPDRAMEPKDLFAKGRDFLEMYNKVTEFTKELMEQNAQLKTRIAELEDEGRQAASGGAAADPASRSLFERLEELKRERQEVLDRYHQKEEESKDFNDRYVEVETENNNLANLYVASYQLHSTLDFHEVLNIITEIVINLIGIQTFALWLLDDKKQVLQPMLAEGIARERVPDIVPGEGIIGAVVEGGEIWYREQNNPDAPLDWNQPMVCVPLKIKERVIGVIAVFQLLTQKERLSKVDYDLFTLLAAHAATAIFSARLYSDSVRKRKTIKGFLDLLTH